jgi:serine/threonine protein phosphatase PrpC
MDLRVASLTDMGRARTNNEDSLLAETPLVAVADGMGGHEGGEVASGIAIDVLRTWKDKLDGLSGHEAAEKLREALTDANRAVYAKGQEEEALLSMGTTLTAAWANDDVLALAHVGDSRAYLMRGGKLQQLTEDQTVAQEWVRRGRLSAEEAETSPQRHILLQAIGAEPERLQIDTMTVELRPGDRLMVASDGLSGMVRDRELEEILRAHPDPDEAVRVLVDAANAAGGEDNISVVLLDVAGDPGGAVVEVAEGDPPASVIVDRGPGAGAPSRSRRRFSIPRAGIVAAAAVLVLVVMAVLLLVRPTGPNYVVSTDDEIVVVLDGQVGDLNTPAEGEVVKRYPDEKLDEFSRTAQRRLREGIPVESLAESETVIANQPRQQGPKDTPTPEPKETAEPSASPDASPGASPQDTTG